MTDKARLTPAESDTEFVLPTKTWWPILILVLILFLLIGTGLYTSFSRKLERSVQAVGQLYLTPSGIEIQHVGGGEIHRLFVKNGDSVKSGDILAEMVSNEVQTELDTNQKLALQLAIQEQRLEAQLGRMPMLSAIPTDLPKIYEDYASAILAEEIQVFETWEASLLALQQELNSSIDRTEVSQLHAVEREIAIRNRILELERRITTLRPVAKRGFIAKNRVRDLEMELQREQQALSSELATSDQSQASVKELQASYEKQKAEERVNLARQLSQVQARRAEVQGILNRLADARANAKVVAPRDGVVEDLAIGRESNVLMAGQRLLTLIPLDAKFQVKAQLNNLQIEGIEQGMTAKLSITFDEASQTKTFEGKVERLDRDAEIDPDTGQPLYAVEIAYDPEIFPTKPISGMAVQVAIPIGDDTIMNTLTDPLIRTLRDSFGI